MQIPTARAVTVAAFLTLSAHGEWRPALGTNETAHLGSVLGLLNMNTNDLGFEKDVGRPTNTLTYVREMLDAPLRLPVMADELMLSIGTHGVTSLWETCARFLEVPSREPAQPPAPPPADTFACTNSALAPNLAAALNRFVATARVLSSNISNAFSNLSTEQHAYLAACQVLPMLGGSGDLGAVNAARSCGIPAAVIDAVRAGEDSIDPEPEAVRVLDLIARIDFSLLFGAGRELQREARHLGTTAHTCTDWPSGVVQIESPCGAIIVGTRERDIYAQPAFLILDPGGDDLYIDTGAIANGLQGRPVAAVVDLGGEDHYQSRVTLGPGSALYGASVLFDDGGDDRYDAGQIGQSAALCGVTWLEDAGGNDTYVALKHSQAAATCGIAILWDHAGLDTYDVGTRGQAYAGVRGLGLLIDDTGNDRYVAGGRDGDHERHTEHFLSLAQGFATGDRPFAGGGVAALVDRGGNDTYTADVYGQGVSYWYSVGMLIDTAGHDRYSLHEYGQGSGIHLSFGLLVEGGGNDVYYGWSLAQGNAHDYAVGMLLDHGGDDTYTADHYSQGRGINNALGILLDSDGRDAYLGRQPNACQGIGHNSRNRDYGSVALLLDLKGQDIYTCGATNGAALFRDDIGIVYDYGEAR